MSIQRALDIEAGRASQAASQQPADDAYRPAGMSPAYLWTGIGLMAAGGSTLISGALIGGAGDGVCRDLDLDCGHLSKSMIGVGAAMIAAGGIVSVLGRNKARRSSPQIVAGQGRVWLRSRVTF
jgi:hypothetical protein